MGEDRILDFSPDKDVIDLSELDGNIATVELDTFTFIGRTKFSGTAGELRYWVRPDEVRIWGDVDGDGKSDFVIRVADVRSVYEDDFVL